MYTSSLNLDLFFNLCFYYTYIIQCNENKYIKNAEKFVLQCIVSNIRSTKKKKNLSTKIFSFSYSPSLFMDLRSYDPLRIDGTLPLGKPCPSTTHSCTYMQLVVSLKTKYIFTDSSEQRKDINYAENYSLKMSSLFYAPNVPRDKNFQNRIPQKQLVSSPSINNIKRQFQNGLRNKSIGKQKCQTTEIEGIQVLYTVQMSTVTTVLSVPCRQ